MTRWRNLGLVLAMSGMMTAAAGAQVIFQEEQGGKGDLVPTGKGWGVPGASLEKRAHRPPRPPMTNNGINYHNGPVMLGTTNVYYIWYGNWGGDSAVDILTDEAESIGGTPWFNINTTYFDKTNKHVSNAVAYKGATTDDYSRGNTLSDDDVEGVVVDAINSGRLPKDPHGVYFVITSSDVDESSGFCTNYCGWHSSDTIAGADVKFAFIGGAGRCPRTCTRQATRSPNDNPAADGMASTLAHELSESVTDPDLNAWYDTHGNENADKCAWKFGNIYTAPNGTGANVRWGARDFLIQQNWVNAKGGSCVVSYP